MTAEEACHLYSISVEELTGWQQSIARSGTPGLRVTRIRHYRALHRSSSEQHCGAADCREKTVSDMNGSESLRQLTRS
jgi:hypothetical protein